MSTSKRDRDELTLFERGLELVLALAGMTLLFGFFLVHQLTDTGFFTDKFGATAMFCLYAPILVNPSSSIIRAVIGRRNPARPIEAATSLFLGACSYWLLIEFPFDYTHLTDPLPASTRFPFEWITDDIGRLFLILQVIISPITALLTMWRYFRVAARRALPNDG